MVRSVLLSLALILSAGCQFVPGFGDVSKVVSISGAGAVKDDGTVWTWDDLIENAIQVPDLTTAVAVADRWFDGGAALDFDGSIWAWGTNDVGQLGLGTVDDGLHPLPARVPDLTGIVAIANCCSYTMALDGDGIVWTWGNNACGYLGLGTADGDPHPTPSRIGGVSRVVNIAASGSHSVAVREDGTVWTWGSNLWGQLGQGTEDVDSHPDPQMVEGLSGIVAVAVGSMYAHTVALSDDGTVWARGANDYAQLGDGTNVDSSTPVRVSGLSGVVAIAAGWIHSVALRVDGTVWAWGDNGCGSLGDGTKVDRNRPVRAAGLTGVVAIAAAGTRDTVALREDSTVWAYGYASRSTVPRLVSWSAR